MQSIKLTQEHKDKLLEMCKALFPELQKKAYNKSLKYYSDINQAEGFYITGLNFIGCSYPIDSRDDSYHHHLFEQIHWFEFCWILLNKLIKKSSPLETTKFISYFGIVCFNRSEFNHPVNYLYNEFKKLK